MDEQERIVTGAKPGDVLSLEVDAENAPRLGARMTMITFPRERADEPLKTSFLPSDTGGWEVIRVDSSPAGASKVKISIRHR